MPQEWANYPVSKEGRRDSFHGLSYCCQLTLVRTHTHTHMQAHMQAMLVEWVNGGSQPPCVQRATSNL